MTKFQTAQERQPRNVWSYDPSAIYQLHDDPITDITELITCSSGSPEDILIALESLAQESYLDQTETRQTIEITLPTTTNLSEMDRYTKVAIHKPSRWKACLKPTSER
tara:strand:+ start:1218 stop:1541 length:324 start_codon:yes stop_codon:yes gene_type:complete